MDLSINGGNATKINTGKTLNQVDNPITPLLILTAPAKSPALQLIIEITVWRHR